MNTDSKIKQLFFKLTHLFSSDEKIIEEMLDNARRDEREETENKWGKKYDKTLERHEKEKIFLKKDKDAKIKSLKQELEEKNKYIERVEEVYEFCKRQIKKNMSLATELKIQVWRAQQNQTDTFQALSKIVTEAEGYALEFEENEENFKRLLSYDGKPKIRKI